MTTTWTIAIDWDRDGSFSGQYDDVTSYIISAGWFLGERTPYQDTADNSTLTLVLNNSDKRYSPENGSSPMAGKLTPFKPVRIQSYDGSNTRTHWMGWIESIQPTVGTYGERTVEISAAGPMQFYKAAETALDLQENMRTNDIIAALIKEVVIPPALVGAWVLGRVGNSELDATTRLADVTQYSILDPGIKTLAIAADNWVQRGGLNDQKKDTFDVYRAVKDVVAAERGRFLFSRDGKALFWNRHRLIDEVTVSATFDNAMQGLDYQYAGLEEFKNEIIVVCHPRAVSVSNQDILWELDEEVRISAGKSRTINAKYQDGSDNRIGGKEVTLTNVKFRFETQPELGGELYGENGYTVHNGESSAGESAEGEAWVKLDARANSAEIEITNVGTADAILTSAALRGRKITDFGQMEAKAIDSASIIDYGRRTLRLNLPSVDNFDDAETIAQFERQRRSQPQGAVKSLTLKSHGKTGGNAHAHQLARTLGDKIIVAEDQAGHIGSYYIVGEQHRLSASATLFETTWYLEPAPDTYPWKLGVTGRSELGQATTLAY
jgi:hypothetical protein